MASTWVVVAHQAGARFFEFRNAPKSLTLVRELDNPDGAKRNREIDSDRPGSASVGAAAPGNVKRGMAHEQTAHERVVQNFAREVAEALRKARNANEIDELLLVAEPGFLGELTGALDKPTAKLIAAKVHKDLAIADADEVLEHVTRAIKPSTDPVQPRR
jgi:protein required for attachment to host cells